MKAKTVKYTSKPELVNAKTNRAREHRQRMKKVHRKARGMNPQYKRKS